MTFITLAVFIVVVLCIGPIFSIMALNALFGLGIELTVGTWFAMAWVHIVLSRPVTSRSKVLGTFGVD